MCNTGLSFPVCLKHPLLVDERLIWLHLDKPRWLPDAYRVHILPSTCWILPRSVLLCNSPLTTKLIVYSEVYKWKLSTYYFKLLLFLSHWLKGISPFGDPERVHLSGNTWSSRIIIFSLISGVVTISL